jgi:serine/threonine protein kinase
MGRVTRSVASRVLIDLWLATNVAPCVQLIGAGGFGEVFRGNMLPFGEIVVKKLQQRFGDFEREIAVRQALVNGNLLELCCHATNPNGQQYYLVYPYIAGGDLGAYIILDPSSGLVFFMMMSTI